MKNEFDLFDLMILGLMLIVFAKPLSKSIVIIWSKVSKKTLNWVSDKLKKL
jgi:hypothetical protein